MNRKHVAIILTDTCFGQIGVRNPESNEARYRVKIV